MSFSDTEDLFHRSPGAGARYETKSGLKIFSSGTPATTFSEASLMSSILLFILSPESVLPIMPMFSFPIWIAYKAFSKVKSFFWQFQSFSKRKSWQHWLECWSWLKARTSSPFAKLGRLLLLPARPLPTKLEAEAIELKSKIAEVSMLHVTSLGLEWLLMLLLGREQELDDGQTKLMLLWAEDLVNIISLSYDDTQIHSLHYL